MRRRPPSIWTQMSQSLERGKKKAKKAGREKEFQESLCKFSEDVVQIPQKVEAVLREEVKG